MARASLLVAVVVGAMTVRGTSSMPGRDAHAATAPDGLPSHFAIGVFAHPDPNGITGWMPSTGVPWDYSYISLSHGVNTDSGWATWRPDATFPLYYAQMASRHGYIPVFTFYNLLQSNGACNACADAQRDLSNLNNPTLMAAYFANFTILMQRLGPGTYDGIQGYGRTTIVHVEPDLAGYAERAALDNSACFGYCTAQGNNPSYVRAAVGGSGVANLAGYPNTFAGFTQALGHLRDLYAPNVKLAVHLSNWATGYDIGNRTDPANAAALGREAGLFLTQAGPADLLFNDVDDRDAGYYKYVLGVPSRWWDARNLRLPTFHRWETYIQAAAQETGRPVMEWQVPEGNQYYDSENNTWGHYQDNVAQYIFDHIGELVRSGIVGVLFGVGNPGSTAHWDLTGDGVTNPAPFCTADGLSSGQVCNAHPSAVSDDDGGYIRLRAQQYYAAGPFSLGEEGSPPVNDAPIVAISCSGGAEPATTYPGWTEHLGVSITANSTISAALAAFDIYDASGAKVYQTYSGPLTLSAHVDQGIATSWSLPAHLPVGNYSVNVLVFGPNWTPLSSTGGVCASFDVA